MSEWTSKIEHTNKTYVTIVLNTNSSCIWISFISCLCYLVWRPFSISFLFISACRSVWVYTNILSYCIWTTLWICNYQPVGDTWSTTSNNIKSMTWVLRIWCTSTSKQPCIRIWCSSSRCRTCKLNWSYFFVVLWYLKHDAINDWTV